MARNRQKAKERQARRKAQKGNGGEAKSAPSGATGVTRSPTTCSTSSSARRSPRPAPTRSITPPLSGSERLRAPDAAEADAEPELGYPDIENDPEHFDPAEDQPEDVDDLTPGPRGRRGKEAQPDSEGGSRLVQFLKSVVAELRRVQWPDRQATTTLTGVVLGFVIIAGSYLGLLDAIFSRLVDLII